MIAVFFCSMALAASGEWRLVGAYDAALLAGEEAGPVLVPDPALSETCGRPRQALGLSAQEADLLASGQMSALALVLERPPGERGPVDRRRLRALIRPPAGLHPPAGVPEVALEPAVRGRDIALDIQPMDPEDPDVQRLADLVALHLATTLCLEHLVGRAWTGASELMGEPSPELRAQARIREAFLLDPVPRPYFVGQGLPVPPLLSAPSACILDTESPGVSRAGEVDALGGAEDATGDARLHKSDVWRARLPPCSEDPAALRVRVQVSRTDDKRHLAIALSWAGDGLPPAPGPLLTDASSLGTRAEVHDAAAWIPHFLPTFGPPSDPEEAVLLLVPSWQIATAASVLELGPMIEEVREDPVGWLLQHPSWLVLAIASDDPRSPWRTVVSSLAEVSGPLAWGDPAGARSAESPVAGPDAVWVEDQSGPHRRLPAALLLASAGVALLFGVTGARRLSELRLAPVIERSPWWPERPPPAEPPLLAGPRAAPREAGEP